MTFSFIYLNNLHSSFENHFQEILPWDFRMMIIRDMALGMQYLPPCNDSSDCSSVFPFFFFPLFSSLIFVPLSFSFALQITEISGAQMFS